MTGPASPTSTNACRACGSATAHPFASGGVCLRCAGERVLGGLDFSLPPPLELPPGADRAPLEKLGPYAIIEQIGRGGMGRVYAARQAGLGRIVALKALPEGRGDVAGLELRFLREAQTAARLRHPHIVNVHDSGRADGHVYFTMDYIEDGDLAHRLRAQPFTPRAAAVLMEKVARALAYTHGEGVLHRDLKPSNILLDGEEPRLADFGLASQLEPGGDLTAVSGVLGTPHYVAPEALRDGSGSLTEASDLYALGVILYELLTGRTPFAGASPAQLLQLAERERPLPLRLLAPAVPRDLETICLKCLEREPTLRYANAAALAEDLRRFLAGEPILAHAPGWWRVSRQFARRHRFALLAVSSIMLVLVCATLVSTSLALRARRAEKTAAAEAKASRALADFLQHDLLEQASPNSLHDRDVKLRTVLDRAAAQVDHRFGDQPEIEATLRETLGRTYLALGAFAEASQHYSRAVALRQGLAGPDDPAALVVESLLADSKRQEGKLPDAEKISRSVAARQLRLLGRDHPDTLHTLDGLATVLRYRGKYAEAQSWLEDILARRRRLQGPEHPDLLETLDNLALVYLRLGRNEEAEALARQAVANTLKARGPEHPDTLSAQNDLAVILRELGKLEETENIHRSLLAIRQRQLGPDHHDTLITMNNLALTYRSQGKFSEAEPIQRQVVEIMTRTIGPDHRDTLIALGNLASNLKLQRRYPEAIELTQRVIATRRRVLGSDHAETMNSVTNLGDIYLKQEDFKSAEPVLREIWEYQKRTAPNGWVTAAATGRLGYALTHLGRFEEAEVLVVSGYLDFVAREKQVPGLSKGLLKDAGDYVVELYEAWGRPDRAAEWRAKIAAKPAG